MVDPYLEAAARVVVTVLSITGGTDLFYQDIRRSGLDRTSRAPTSICDLYALTALLRTRVRRARKARPLPTTRRALVHKATRAIESAWTFVDGAYDHADLRQLASYARQMRRAAQAFNRLCEDLACR